MNNLRVILRSGALIALLVAACQRTPPERVRFFAGGNCAECQSPIEAAVRALPGVDSVGWDHASSLLGVRYDPSVVGADDIQRQVAAAGFDTQFYPADEEARKRLPVCCQEPVNRRLKEFLPGSH